MTVAHTPGDGRRAEHVWVEFAPSYGGGRAPGLLLQWRRGRRGWEGWVVWIEVGHPAGPGPRVVQAWVGSDLIRPADR
ncbi:MAG: hypothetical protein Q8Q02_11030 [Nocardioides sp.]|nr:hypothetical protein [Nocardioides sp.]